MISGILNTHFIVRQIIRSRRQAVVFVLCVALSIVTLISLNGFSASVSTSMLNDAKTLHAADIIIHAHADLSPSITHSVAQLKADDDIAPVVPVQNIVTTVAIEEIIPGPR